jgi:hypothetical protein
MTSVVSGAASGRAVVFLADRKVDVAGAAHRLEREGDEERVGPDRLASAAQRAAHSAGAIPGVHAAAAAGTAASAASKAADAPKPRACHRRPL